MTAILDLARRVRLRALLTEQLSNGTEVWQARGAGSAVPALRFRNGLVLFDSAADSGFAFTLTDSRRCGPLFRARRID